MVAAGTSDPFDEGRSRDLASSRFENDLVGLDPDDPEAQEFAQHLDRMERVRPPGYTVEGYLSDMGEFADGANRHGGHYRLMATILVVLILLGILLASWDSLVYLLGRVFG
jgi:hypothetical protein